jgi:hypothetical protein
MAENRMMKTSKKAVLAPPADAAVTIMVPARLEVI